MPVNHKPQKQLSLSFIIQFIAGVVFIGLGIFILTTQFKNNTILVGTTRLLFGGILCLYGIVRLIRIYLTWKTKNDYNYEDTDI